VSEPFFPHNPIPGRASVSNKAEALGRARQPSPRDKKASVQGQGALSSALSLGSTASSCVETAQSGPGDRENIPSSEMEVEEDERRSEEEVGQGCLPGWGARRAA